MGPLTLWAKQHQDTAHQQYGGLKRTGKRGMSTHSCFNAGRKSIAAPCFRSLVPTSKASGGKTEGGPGRGRELFEKRRRTKQPVCSPVSSRVPPAAAGHIWKTSVLLVCELLAFQAYLPLGFFFFLVVVDSSALPHQLRKLKCNEADNVDCLAADQMSIKQELLTRSLMIEE